MSLDKWRDYQWQQRQWAEDRLPAHLRADAFTGGGWGGGVDGTNGGAGMDWTGRADALNRLNGEWLGTLNPQQRAEYDAMADFNRQREAKHQQTTMRIGSLIPAAVMGYGLYGALAGGAGAGAGAGSAGLEAALPAGLAEGAPSLANMTAAEMAGLGAGGTGAAGAMPSFANVVSGSSSTAPAGWLSQAGGAISSGAKWLGDNRGLVSLLGGLASTAGSAAGKTTGSAPAQAFAPQPGMAPGAMRQTRAAPGLAQFLAGNPAVLGNSGLARFGAMGGTYQPQAGLPVAWGR